MLGDGTTLHEKVLIPSTKYKFQLEMKQRTPKEKERTEQEVENITKIMWQEVTIEFEFKLGLESVSIK